MGSEFFDELSVKFTKTAKDLSERAEQIYETQKLRNKIASEERIIEKIKADIGNILYKRYTGGTALDEDLAVLCQRIDEHMDQIEKHKSDLADMRGKKICPSCKEAIIKDAVFCPNCGAACPEPEPEVVEVPEEDIEVVNEAGETVEKETEETVVEEVVSEAAEEVSAPEEEPAEEKKENE